MRDPAGTGRGGVLMAGGQEGQGASEGEWGEGPSLAITAMFCLEFVCVFRPSVSMRTVASEHPFCGHIHEFLYISHLFHLIYFLVKHISNI